MSDRLSLDQIREYWTDQARQHGTSPAASWSDLRVIDLEVREILSRIEDGERILDVGCSNGHATCLLAREKRVSVRGVDYIPEMIAQARARLPAVEASLRGTVEFAVGDVTRLEEPDGSYDKLVVTRVVINLGTWELQRVALRECARVLKPGGTLLLSEAWMQGWSRLNQMRREWQLPELPMPPFNLYLDEARVIDALADCLDLVEVSNFASTYYVGTRILKPLLARLSPAPIDVADPMMEWNRWCAQLPAWGDYGTQKLLVFRKRE